MVVPLMHNATPYQIANRIVRAAAEEKTTLAEKLTQAATQSHVTQQQIIVVKKILESWGFEDFDQIIDVDLAELDDAR